MKINFTFLMLVIVTASCKKEKITNDTSSFLAGQIYRKVSLDTDGLPYKIREIEFKNSSQLTFTKKGISGSDTTITGPVMIRYTYDPDSQLITYSSNPPVFYKYTADSLVKIIIIPTDTFIDYQTLYRVK